MSYWPKAFLFLLPSLWIWKSNTWIFSRKCNYGEFHRESNLTVTFFPQFPVMIFFQHWSRQIIEREHMLIQEISVTDRRAALRGMITLGSLGKSTGIFTFNTKECHIKIRLKLGIHGEDHKDIWEANHCLLNKHRGNNLTCFSDRKGKQYFVSELDRQGRHKQKQKCLSQADYYMKCNLWWWYFSLMSLLKKYYLLTSTSEMP